MRAWKAHRRGWVGVPQALAGEQVTVVAEMTPPPWRAGWEQNQSWASLHEGAGTQTHGVPVSTGPLQKSPITLPVQTETPFSPQLSQSPRRETFSFGLNELVTCPEGSSFEPPMPTGSPLWRRDKDATGSGQRRLPGSEA